MRPVKTKTVTGTYGAPRGLEAGVGGLPFWRETNDIAGHKISTVYSAWKFEPWELAVLAEGGALILGIVGMEPIPPVSFSVAGADEARAQEEVAETATDPAPSDSP